MMFGFDGRRRDRAVIQFLWTLRENYTADPRLNAAVRRRLGDVDNGGCYGGCRRRRMLRFELEVVLGAD